MMSANKLTNIALFRHHSESEFASSEANSQIKLRFMRIQKVDVNCKIVPARIVITIAHHAIWYGFWDRPQKFP